MALTSNTWYLLIVAPLANPPWVAPSRELPGEVIDAIIASTSLYCFCKSDNGTEARLITASGAEFYAPSTALSVAATPTMNTTTLDSGEKWYSIRGATTEWHFYSTTQGMMALTNSITLGAFIS